jgi:formamidopyrimidine-DNA glycosylase
VPELPEVESVRRQLAPQVIGRRVVDVWRDPYPSARITDVEQVLGHRIADCGAAASSSSPTSTGAVTAPCVNSSCTWG